MTLHDPTTAATEDLSADEAEIVSVIRAETATAKALDFEAWSACWIQDERVREVFNSEASGVIVHRGWTAVADSMRHVIENDLSCDVEHWDMRDIQVVIQGDVAWVTYDCLATYASGRTGQNFETRILERTVEGWKILSLHVDMLRRQPAVTSVCVDATGRITAAPEEARAALKAHPILTISANRLRARRRDWDKRLQAAFEVAGAHNGFYELHRFERETGGTFRYPVVLGETDEGGVAVIHITAKDGVTYVAIDGHVDIARRLSSAKAVFGLSDAQSRCASLIAEGHGLPRVAEAMGITVNTARTHLNRLYEKTGVNAQTALVRLLLSVG